MIRWSHFTAAIPYQPGTMARSGNPCARSERLAIHLQGEQNIVERFA